MIVEECLRTSPDVICLQEVDHFEEINASLDPEYAGAFFPKGRSASQFGKDGAAIFWRTETFELRSKAKFHFSEICKQATMGQIVGTALLKCRFGTERRHLRVVTTHLKAKVEFEAMRTVQANALAELLGRAELNDAGLTVLCGDFNTTGDSEAIQSILGRGFNSAYRDLRHAHLGEDSEPAWTTWKIREAVKKQTIDFIFHRQPHPTWQLDDVWCVPEDSNFDPSIALPCSVYPSDHIALAAKFSPKR